MMREGALEPLVFPHMGVNPDCTQPRLDGWQDVRADAITNRPRVPGLDVEFGNDSAKCGWGLLRHDVDHVEEVRETAALDPANLKIVVALREQRNPCALTT